MQHTIIVKRPGEPAELAGFEGTYRGDLTALLGKNITPSYCHLCERNALLRLCLVCDEDGCYKDLEHNFDLVTFGSLGSYHNSLKGTVIFFKYLYEPYQGQEIYDYRLTSLSAQDISFVEYLLGNEYQSKAKEFKR